MEAETGPGAALIAQPLEAAANGDALSARMMAATRWHYIRSRDNRALCGLMLPFGAPKIAWTDVPDDEKCPWCAGRLKA